MIARLTAWAGRLSPFERFLVGWLLAAPIAFAIVFVLGAIVETPLAATFVFIAYYAVAIVCGAIALVTRVRHQRALAGPDSPIVRPAELDDRGVLADHVRPWAAISSDRLERARVVRRTSRRSRQALLFFGMRTKSTWTREPFAYQVTGGRFDYGTLRRLLDPLEWGGDLGESLLVDAELDLLISLSRLVASQNIDERDARFLDNVLDYVVRQRQTLPPRALSKGNQLYLIEKLILVGRLDTAFALIAKIPTVGFTESLYRADTLNPFHPNRLQESEGRWLAAFNAIFSTYGLEPVTLSESGDSPYDRLDAETGDIFSDGPLISVIMTCFQPDHTLRSAVASMVAQTWQNWELIVIDDGSSAEYQAILDEVASTDSRIRIMRSDDNRGTYVRRNDAILVARGEFVTMHDSDDWAHPRRLELQARHLLQNPSDVANVSYSLRVSETLMLVQPRGATMRLTETSLLFRRKEVIERIGYFDSVRKAADSEYRLRIEAAFRRPVPVIDTLAPLALVRYTATSLSGSDLGDGWMHPARVAYRGAQELWRSDISSGKADPYLGYPLVDRPFPAHDRVLGAVPGRLEVDVLVAFDGRAEAHPDGHLAQIVGELTELANAGFSVAVANILTLLEGRPSGILSGPVQRLINDGIVRQVLLEDDVNARVTAVRNASVLQAAPSTLTQISSDRVVVFVDEAAGLDLREESYAAGVVEEEAMRLFSGPVDWAPIDSAMTADTLGLHEVTIDDIPFAAEEKLGTA